MRVRAPRRARVAVEANVEPDNPGVNYALRMTEALDAISSAQTDVDTDLASERREPARGRARPPEPIGHPEDRVDAEPPRRARSGFGTPKPTRTAPPQAAWFKRLENLPPIRLPIGPAIPWRLGVPVVVVLVTVGVFFARPSAPSESRVSRLPTPDTYPVQQEAPLFTAAQPTPAPAPVAQPIGVPDSAGAGFDVVDVGIKLIAVLALAYGSLLLLKRAGLGGATTIKAGGKVSGLQVVSSLTLAPNRTVHLLKVPGGKTVLVGATPNQVNLIADLGVLDEDPESDTAASFFDVLKGKIPQ